MITLTSLEDAKARLNTKNFGSCKVIPSSDTLQAVSRVPGT
jgi:hypothetical protein